MRVGCEIFAAGLALTASSCTNVEMPPPEGQCENRHVSDFRSQDGRFKAVSFTRHCGTQLSTTNVSVLNPGEPLPNEPDNALAEQTTKPRPAGYAQSLQLEWTSDNRLRIIRSENIVAGALADSIGEVAIEHSTVEDPTGP